MNKPILYWVTIFISLFCCIGYNMLTARKYQLKWWKFLIITIIAFAWNWGSAYLAAWVEVGFKTPPEVNMVRAWVYSPIFFFISALIFKLDFRRLCDAITPCYVLGFAFGHLGCVFGGCCYGYPYDGFGAIYNHVLGYYTFPIQVVESVCAFILFIGYIVYILRVNFKITGRQYAVMLMFFSARFILDLFRDNEKLIGRISILSIHALIGGVVGAIWFFFTTAPGYVLAAKMRNFFRKIIKKEPLPVKTRQEYHDAIKNREDQTCPPVKAKGTVA